MQEEKKNNLTFIKILGIVSVILLLVCIFFWIKLSKFIDEFEQTLNVEVQNITQEKVEDTVTEEKLAVLLEDGDSEFYQQLTLEVAQSYAKFTSADLEYKDIKNYFQEGSEILELLETYNNNRYNKHENSYFEEIQLEQPTITQTELIKCQVSFDYVVITSEGTHVYPSAYTLYFDSTDNKVVAIEMS